MGTEEEILLSTIDCFVLVSAELAHCVGNTLEE